jgi:hypothetical protein
MIVFISLWNDYCLSSNISRKGKGEGERLETSSGRLLFFFFFSLLLLLLLFFVKTITVLCHSFIFVYGQRYNW